MINFLLNGTKYAMSDSGEKIIKKEKTTPSVDISIMEFVEAVNQYLEDKTAIKRPSEAFYYDGKTYVKLGNGICCKGKPYRYISDTAYYNAKGKMLEELFDESSD